MLLGTKWSRLFCSLAAAFGASMLIVAGIQSIIFQSFDSFGLLLLFYGNPRADTQQCQLDCILAISGMCVLSLVIFVMQFFFIPEPPAPPKSAPLKIDGSHDAMFKIRSLSSDNLLDTKPKSLADFNYFEEENMSQLLRSIYLEIIPVFDDLGTRFGFQTDNVRNQREHLLFLLSNSSMRRKVDPIDSLHSRFFSNYINWCKFIRIDPVISNSRLGDQHQKTFEIVLWLLVWGESSNIRHLPECLCYLFHCSYIEYKTHSTAILPAGTFLSFVIKPIYDAIRSPGKALIPMNYDDFNEFFWSSSCFNYHYGIPDPQRHQEQSEKPHIAEGLMNTGKTFLELRSHLRFVIAYWRLFSCLTVMFYFQAVYAILNSESLKDDVSAIQYQLALESTVLVLAASKVIKELLELWSNFNIWPRSSFFVRLLTKFILFVSLSVLFAMAFRDSDADENPSLLLFHVCSGIFLIPLFLEIIANLFPSIFFSSVIRLSHRIPLLGSFTDWWWPSTKSYVGRIMPVTFRESIRYQLFWSTLIAFKLLCSYYFEVKPLAEPSVNIFTHESFDTGLFSGSRIIVLVSLWLPFLMVYFLDLTIWYCVWQAIFGALVGMTLEGLGQIRNFSALKKNFIAASLNFHGKLIGKLRRKSSSSVVPSPFSLQSSFTYVQLPNDVESPLLDPEQPDEDAKQNSLEVFQTEAMLVFSHAWNAIVKDLRNRDLISDTEHEFLVFRGVSGRQDRKLYIPAFLSAGCIDNTIAFCSDIAEKFTSGTKVTQELVMELENFFTSDAIVSEALGELWELLTWVFQTLLGEKHIESLISVNDAFYSLCRCRTVLSEMHLERFDRVKSSLQDLIRLLNLSQKMFEKRSKESKVDEPKHQKMEFEEKEETKNPEDFKVSRLAQSIPKSTLTSSMSYGSLNMLEKLSRAPSQATDREIVLVRKQLRQLIESLQSTGSAEMQRFLKTIIIDKHGFFWDDSYARTQLDSFLSEPICRPALRALHMLLNLATIDAKPINSEAQRRLLFWMNSLLQDMPQPAEVSESLSLSTLTPFYSEDIVYSTNDLESEWSTGGVSPINYLQSVHSRQWNNFLERMKLLNSEDRYNVLSSSNEELSKEARLWATKLGQTLYRTTVGIMLYEEAIRLLSRLEDKTLNDMEVEELCKLKFNYVISAQVYGQQKQTMDPKAQDIDYLLNLFPNLRVAYIDNKKVHVFNQKNQPVELDEYYSVLIKCQTIGKKKEIQEVYRVKLPGNPIVGEGKPENQNHAIIFSRGEFLQAIDMNQDNYFEEALKMRNLLELFDPDTRCFGHYPNTTIMGFREHVFTGGLSSIANFMAMQEGTFVSLGQRVLSEPLRLRFHYGHPDVFDKIFFSCRGGISKASKGVNLSEDIFAGYNNTLRGGSVGMREFLLVGKGRDVGLQQLYKFEAKLSQGAAEQSLSREVNRLGSQLDFGRMLALYNGGPGWYISNVITMWAAFLFAYAKVYWGLFGTEYVDFAPAETSLSYWFGQVGFLMTVPTFAAMGVDKGFRVAAWEIIRMVISGGPLFFIFNMATKWYYFEQTLLAGNAQYRPTGRGFVTKHESFSELYRFHWTSHYLPAVELGSCLLLYRLVVSSSVAMHYSAVTWSLWLLVFSWLFTPYWFNPLSFEWEQVVIDFSDWWLWMRRSQGNASTSWRIWWKEETAFYQKLTRWKRIQLALLYSRFVLIALGILYHSRCSLGRLGGATAVLCGLIILWSVFHAKFSQRYGRIAVLIRTCICVGVVSVFVAVYQSTVMFGFTRSFKAVSSILLLLSVVGHVAITWGLQWDILRELSRLFHLLVGLILFVPLAVLSILYLPSIVQTRILFHNAFSRGVMVDELLKTRGNASSKNGKAAEETLTTQAHIIEKQKEEIDRLVKVLEDKTVKPDAERPIPKTVMSARSIPINPSPSL